MSTELKQKSWHPEYDENFTLPKTKYGVKVTAEQFVCILLSQFSIRQTFADRNFFHGRPTISSSLVDKITKI